MFFYRGDLTGIRVAAILVFVVEHYWEQAENGRDMGEIQDGGNVKPCEISIQPLRAGYNFFFVKMIERKIAPQFASILISIYLVLYFQSLKSCVSVDQLSLWRD